jgi:methyltransferase (TIGR00027 family)
MEPGKPSRTALAAATHRAAHQVFEHGRIFTDPLAVQILGAEAEMIEDHPARRRMRIFIAVRTRFAEDALAAAVERGVGQLVVLGAGLDTFAYRSPLRSRLRIFEVDHPATQAWKRQRLEEAGILAPDSLTFAPVDFERETLLDGLLNAGLDAAQETFFTWLGVVPYLSEKAVWSTLALIGSLRGGAHIVFDYADPPETLSPEARAFHDQRAERVQAMGEAWVTYFKSDKLHAGLSTLGFSQIEDLGPRQIASRYFPDRASTAPEKGGHIIRATTRLPL